MRVDEEAEFRAFVAARQDSLLRTACLLAGGDWAAGEDLLQTALARTFVSWRRIRDKGALDAYVRRTMARTATSWWRRRSSSERPVATTPDAPTVADHAAGSAERDALWRVVRALPPGQRAVLVLRYHADLTEAQTAAELGISVGTVKSQTSRALRRLRAELRAEPGVDAASRSNDVRHRGGAE